MKFNLYKSGNPDNPTILFLHGFMGCASDWNEIVSLLETDWHCIAVDLPGHGSHRIRKAVTLNECAQALVTTVRREGLNISGLVGYSMGGRLAIFLATHYPDFCKKLVIESAAPGLRSEEERVQRRRSDRQLIKSMRLNNFKEFLRRWYRMPIFASIEKNAKLEGITLIG